LSVIDILVILKEGANMKNCITTILLASFFVLGFTSKVYSLDPNYGIDISLACPQFVGAGEPLFVTVNMEVFYNCTSPGGCICSPGPDSAIPTAMVGIIGNPSDSTGIPVIYGPWSRRVNLNLCGLSTISFPINITQTTDALLGGTVAGASVMLLDINGQPVAGDACAVAVKP
jgi:hypothetical protein